MTLLTMNRWKQSQIFLSPPAVSESSVLLTFRHSLGLQQAQSILARELISIFSHSLRIRHFECEARHSLEDQPLAPWAGLAASHIRLPEHRLVELHGFRWTLPAKAVFPRSTMNNHPFLQLQTQQTVSFHPLHTLARGVRESITLRPLYDPRRG
ncbi:hypothetical protein C8J56DRAFT_164840 [Mycena floridula]|nr:hypothetical protein C8J56DRAFT_164840 [Mycena floridula]